RRPPPAPEPCVVRPGLRRHIEHRFYHRRRGDRYSLADLSDTAPVPAPAGDLDGIFGAFAVGATIVAAFGRGTATARMGALFRIFIVSHGRILLIGSHYTDRRALGNEGSGPGC